VRTFYYLRDAVTGVKLYPLGRLLAMFYPCSIRFVAGLWGSVLRKLTLEALRIVVLLGFALSGNPRAGLGRETISPLLR
jgi:hypothetical protein